MDESEQIQIRKEKVVKFLKKNYNSVSYVILAVITYMAVRIRTRNLPGLRDVTTGTWTLGPDLDPFLFLRWAKYIVENGSLFAVDMMRYVPLGFQTKEELILHPYLIAWFHKMAVYFGSESVTHSAVLYPAFMFGLTVIVFFFMTRKIFSTSFGGLPSNALALIASFFLSVIPSLLPRTIAGIPEKESSGLFFLFLTFYFFVSSWNSEGKRRYLYALLAGASTAGMGLVWGGYIYIFTTIGLAVFVAFLLGKVENKDFHTYAIWLISSIGLMVYFSSRHSVMNFVSSTTTSLAVFNLALIFVDLFLFDRINVSLNKIKFLEKLPRQAISLIVAIVLGIIIVSTLIGPSFLFEKSVSLKNQLVSPTADRLGVTVAENRQPFFTEWSGNFGPAIEIKLFLLFGPTVINNLPLIFWLFFLGSIFLFYKTVKPLPKKGRRLVTIGFVIFLVGLVFSRYSEGSTFNGTNFVSLFLYAGGLLTLIGTFGVIFYRGHKNGEKGKLEKIDFSMVFLLSFFLISIISARSAIRLVMMLVPSASIMVAYVVVDSFKWATTEEKKYAKLFAWILVMLILMSAFFAGYAFYNSVKSSSQGYVPSVYTQQWQRAMGWVRESTSQDAVFGHWWDYGYWVQSMGERATVLDGGNAKSYWNHLMGRSALTGPDEGEALEFLYAHNTTHFLIDSTDIGKYSAFSTIGSDASYDRASYIPTILRDPNQVQERKNSTIFVYPNGVGLDEDIIYESNGTKIFLPSGQAGLGAILIERDSEGVIAGPAQGIYVYLGKQYTIPLRYIYDNKELIDFGEGLEAGVFTYPSVRQTGSSLQIDPFGAILYLSKRTVNSQLARIYLYKQGGSFKLVHSEDDIIVSQIKSQNPSFDSDFVHYGGLRGPIRIWEIEYPEDIQYNDALIDTHYPEGIRSAR